MSNNQQTQTTKKKLAKRQSLFITPRAESNDESTDMLMPNFPFT